MFTRDHLHWHRTLAAKLLAPIAIMLLVVLVLGLAGSAARQRIVAAHRNVEARQKVRVELIEIRSLSRSLQRDALNLIVEPVPAERAVITDKVTSRLREMGRALRRLGADKNFAGGERRTFIAEQRAVMALLHQSAALATQGRRADALTRFRAQVRPAERRASQLADRLVSEQARVVDEQLALARAIERRETVMGLATSVLLFIFAAAVTLVVVRRLVSQPLRDIEDAMTRLAAGEAEGSTPHGDRDDEIGRMARAIEVFRAAARHQDDLRAMHAAQLERALAAERGQRTLDQVQAVRDRRLAAAAKVLERDTAVTFADSRAAAASLHIAAKTLADVSASTRAELDQVKAATSRVTTGAADIAAATDHFMTDLDRSRTATRDAASEGRAAAEQVDALVEQMRRVADDGERVATAIDLVGDIARQTDLLALNASIEAARAGAAGRGFAVVANEVKALALEAARVTTEIGRRVEGMRAATGEAGDSLRIVGAIVVRLAEQSATLADEIDVQTEQGSIISHNVAGTAADLDLIASRVSDAAVGAAKVDQLSNQLGHDASGIAARTERLGTALERFFADLNQLDAQGTCEKS
ncbi:methyl-accepting chemotaxis protein [Sphingomonas palmae]|uniref:Methyl-accepting chemotaxis protein n=1 Tax=Sphingomonas palmae TaxID=1855283 RepID=A0A1H7PHY1_9SPHN|nr:methyl-accepting chemotaxis protein [Sphingomonas palmae]SEL35088.1 methyl-accepting chemotaxis protein [Sphingomonas palmae]